MKKIVLAFDSFKGSVGSFEIAKAAEKAIQEELPDCQIIRGVSFDARGNRLGRGKGYYDKLLPLLHSYNIGICYNFQVNEKLPVEPFDRRMDEVWTENGILK